MSASGDRLLVSRFISRPLPGEGSATVSTTDANGVALGGEVLVIDPAKLSVVSTTVLAHSERADAENQGRGIPNYLGAAAISPDGKTAWVPGKQDNIKRGGLRDGYALNFQSTVRSISSRIDLGTLGEDLAGRVDHDNASVASAAVYHPTGAYLFVALETNRQVAVLDAAGKRELFRYEVGLAPQGVVVSADGMKLYVSNFMGRSVSVIDLTPLVSFGQTGAAPTATLASVGTEKLTPTVLKGKQLFYDARDSRLARDSYMSCASCHNDGGHDGRVWDFTGQGEGLRNTIALKGRAGIGQGFQHWSANFDEVQDFEGQIRALSGGTGLMADADYNSGTRNQPLGDKKAGLSADLDALAAYVGSLTTFVPSPNRNADGTLTAAAQAGKTVFTTSCANCHGGTGFTQSADASQLKDIGTLKASSGKRLGATLTGIDIPTLRDAWATAPYLHDGSAATLSAAVSAHKGVSLSATDLANVVAYVQQIGGEEPAPLVACASEGGSCVIPAGITADVYYGVNGSYAMRSGLTGSVTCGVASFGVDPVDGAYKSCSYVPTGAYTRTACGGSGSLCSLPAGKVGDVYYGTGTKYSVRTGVTGIVCGNAFLDVNGGASGQSCSYVVTGTASPAPVSALTICAGEGGNCAIPSGVTADVYYGVNGKYTMRTGLTGNVACRVDSFGIDPARFVVKSCGYVVTNTVSKTACANEGGFCALPGGSSGDVYYGANGKFAVRTGMTGMFCDSGRFGFDPNPGVAKSCTYVKP
jgi:mono/diheme cytochrome c family protein